MKIGKKGQITMNSHLGDFDVSEKYLTEVLPLVEALYKKLKELGISGVFAASLANNKQTEMTRMGGFTFIQAGKAADQLYIMDAFKKGMGEGCAVLMDVVGRAITNSSSGSCESDAIISQVLGMALDNRGRLDENGEVVPTKQETH